MKNPLRTTIVPGFAILLALTVCTSKAQRANVFNHKKFIDQNKSEKHTEKVQDKNASPAFYGVSTSKANADTRLLTMNNLCVNYIREVQFLSEWNGTKNFNIDYFCSHNKTVILNINNAHTPSYFPADLTTYQSKLQSFLNVYADSIELAVIENEEMNTVEKSGDLGHYGSMQDYINELTAAVNVCKQKNVPVTNGGLTQPIVISLNHYYEANNKKDSADWLQKQMGGISKDPLLYLRTDSLLNAFKTLDLAYVNLHWYEPQNNMTRATGVLEVVCNYITQQTGKKVISNETGIKGDSSYVTLLMQTWDKIQPKYCIFFDGSGTFGAQPLTTASGSLLPAGVALRNHIGGGNACSQSMTISPSGFVDYCNGDNVVLTATKGYSNYQWNTGETTQSITVKATGNFWVNSKQNNCVVYSNTTQLFMNGGPLKPVITPTPLPPTNLCPDKTATLRSSNASSYLWNTGEKSMSISVKNAGKYCVTISDKDGCRSTSDTISVTYQACNTPANLRVSGISSNKATLNWSVTNCGIGYQVQYRKKGTSAWTSMQVSGGNTSSKTLSNLSSATYEWRMLAYCRYKPDTSKSNYINGPDFTTTGGKGFLNAIAGNMNGADIKIFPVPAKDIATVTINNISNNLKIILTDVYGKVLWQSGKISTNNVNLPLAGLASGVYIVIVQDKVQLKTLRLIKE